MRVSQEYDKSCLEEDSGDYCRYRWGITPHVVIEWGMIPLRLDGIIEQISVKNNHNTAFCDKELAFGTVVKEAIKSETGYRAKYY